MGLGKQEVETTYNRAFLTPLFALIKTLRDILPLQLRKLPYFRRKREFGVTL